MDSRAGLKLGFNFVTIPDIAQSRTTGGCVFYKMAYLHQKCNSRLASNTTYPEIYYSNLKKCDLREFYGDAKEGISNAPA